MIKRNELYFYKILKFNLSFIKELKIRKKPYSIDEIKNKLSKKIDKKINERLNKLPVKPYSSSKVQKSIGLNSIGLLSDRLTILSIKYNALKLRKRMFKEAKHLKDIEIKDTIKCLAKAEKSNGFDFIKITKKNRDIEVNNWNEAYAKLLITNITLWEAQEILYLKDLDNVSSRELRKYIRLFSNLNIKRNQLISECERYYWL